MKFHYAAGAMGYHGEGWFWHRFFNFPELPFISKTITRLPKTGLPFAVLPIGRSVYNKVSLHNCGYDYWRMYHYYRTIEGCTVSIHGTDHDIFTMSISLDDLNIDAIELNFSCPNVRNEQNKLIPHSEKPIYLKLNHTQDPYDYDLDRVAGIRLNSKPMGFCGGSGKVAQKDNWAFIERYNKEGLNVSGCSFDSFDDLMKLEDMGCTEISIGSVILTNPKFVERIVDIL